MKYKVPAVNFIGTMMANVDNDQLSDADFRQMFRNTLPIVEKPEHHTIANADCAARAAKYYPIEEVGINERVEMLKKDLNEYFKDTEIKEYEIYSIKGNNVRLVPINPEFDENYDNDEMDNHIAKIGKKYNLLVAWTSGIRPK